MIPLNFEYGFTIYIFCWLVTIAILWARELWRNRVNDWSLTKDRLCVCDSCHLSFVTKNTENILRCPRCNAMCIVRKRRKL